MTISVNALSRLIPVNEREMMGNDGYHCDANAQLIGHPGCDLGLSIRLLIRGFRVRVPGAHDRRVDHASVVPA